MPILTLTDDEQAYVFRKGYHALNVQYVVAPDLRYQRKCYVYTKIRDCVSDILLKIVLNINLSHISQYRLIRRTCQNGCQIRVDGGH